MKNRLIYFAGIVGVILFISTSVIGGILAEDYSILKQFISESYAVDTKYGLPLRVFGYIPSGILLALFCFQTAQFFKSSRLSKISFYGIGIFYGLATIVVSIFPCDSGCNREMINPSTSQLIHNFTGLLTYALVPFLILLIGFGSDKPMKNNFYFQSKSLGVICILLVCILLFNPNSEYVGLYQRIIELTILLWIVVCSFAVKNIKVSR